MLRSRKKRCLVLAAYASPAAISIASLFVSSVESSLTILFIASRYSGHSFHNDNQLVLPALDLSSLNAPRAQSICDPHFTLFDVKTCGLCHVSHPFTSLAGAQWLASSW